VNEPFNIGNKPGFMQHILTLESKFRKGEGSQKPERKYIDFVVSGQALSQLFAIADLDLIGTFGWSENKAEESRQLDEFLGLKPDALKTNRTSFYVCPNCGDIGCGAITASIEVTETSVIWKDFSLGTDYSEPELETYKHIGPFVFEKNMYTAELEKVRQT